MDVNEDGLLGGAVSEAELLDTKVVEAEAEVDVATDVGALRDDEEGPELLAEAVVVDPRTDSVDMRDVARLTDN